MTEIIRSITSKESLPTIAVNMIVRDEYNNLKELFPIIDGVFDEIVIVDTISLDTSVINGETTRKAIDTFLKKTKTKLVYREWDDDFSAARNEAIKNTNSEYIIWLDADDRIDRKEVFKLKSHLKSNPKTATYLRLLDVRFTGSLQSLQLRVFPRIEGIQFEHKVHEQLTFSLKKLNIPTLAFVDMVITHTGYTTPEVLLAKLKRNYEILDTEWRENQNDFFICLDYARTALSLEKLPEALKASDRSIYIFKNNIDPRIVPEFAVTAYTIKATIFGKYGMHNDAILTLREIEERYPNDTQIKALLCEILFMTGNYEQAHDYLYGVLEKGMELNTMAIDINLLYKTYRFYCMATSLYLGKYELAEKYLKQMLQNDNYSIQKPGGKLE
jgi:glycosyltransferase involved in cell wall biosynthesis